MWRWMWKSTLDSVRRAFWTGRFQQRWCSSQHSFLSQKEKRKTLHVSNLCWLTKWFYMWSKIIIKKNSASLTFYFGHYKGIARFIFTAKDIILFMSGSRWFPSENVTHGQVCFLRLASANVKATYLWKRGQAQISTWKTRCHFLCLWQRTETCPSSWRRPVLRCCPSHRNGLQLCKCLIAETREHFKVKLWIYVIARRKIFGVIQTHHIVVKSSPNFPLLIQAISRAFISAETENRLKTRVSL